MEKRIFINFFPGKMINYYNLSQDKTIKYTCYVGKNLVSIMIEN